MTESAEMLARTERLFDEATRVTAGDSRWRGQTSDDYWAFVGPFGTVSLTTYFHADAEDLAREDISRVLAVADARIFHKSYGDQSSELWSPNGRLLATTHQIAYFKA
jgi:hypothetical protein